MIMDRIPVVTKNLLAINGIMFLALLVAQKNGIDLNNLLGLHFFMSEEFHPYQLVTYMFMHGGFTHLFFNMFALFMFGRTLEYVWGPKRFLIFYMLAGVGAGLVQEAVGAVRYFSLVDGMDAESIGVVLRETLWSLWMFPVSLIAKIISPAKKSLSIPEAPLWSESTPMLAILLSKAISKSVMPFTEISSPAFAASK